jgi:anhydro-N-acetylmuramic acid kinase
MRKIFTALGMMSGTSFDGIDLSIIESDGKEHLKLKKDFYFPFNIKTKNILNKCKKKINNSNFNQISKSKLFLDANRTITLLHAKAANSLLLNYKKNINLIGFHGVTIFHNSDLKKTIQLGNPSLLKQLLKIPVVFNFRENDLKNGGQGAPLIPIYHRVLSKKIKEKKPTIFLNIGGISNYTYINKNKMFASDIGPGNCLLDQWIATNTGKPFDKNGRVSSRGSVDHNFVNNFLDRLDFFTKEKNISYDTSDFNISELRGFNIENGAATLSYLSARLISNKINEFTEIKNVYFGGGGRKNLFLMKLIKKSINATIVKLDKKINGDFLESQAFAYLAIRSLLKLPITFKETTGVKKAVSGGVVFD